MKNNLSQLPASLDTIVFLLRMPLSQRDAQRFGFDTLKSAGFSVVAFDLSKILNPEAREIAGMNSDAQGYTCWEPASIEEFETKLSEYSSRCLVFDCAGGIGDYDIPTAHVLWTLKRNAVPYAVVAAGAVPSSASAPDAAGRIHRIMKKVLKLFLPRLAFGMISRRLIRYVRRAHILPAPVMAFCQYYPDLDQVLSQVGISPTTLTLIHSLDHDRYLEFLQMQSSNGPARLIEGRYGVFLDEAATHHLDFDILGLKKAEPTQYYADLNRFFREVEKKTGAQVVIAAHPSSYYDRLGNPFESRLVIKSKTIDLVAHSEFVIAHSSTSINFAVLFNKPIAVVISDAMLNGFQEVIIDATARELGQKALGLSKVTEFRPEQVNPDQWSKDSHPGYLHKYVKSKGAPDLPNWEMIARAIRQKQKSENA